MQSLQCVYRGHTIIASVEAHEGIPTPFAGGCIITDPQGHDGTRKALPLNMAWMSDLENAQHASLAHGRWLVDQMLAKH